MGLDATSSFTVTAIAGLLICTAAIGIAGVIVGAVERAVSGNLNCLVACFKWIHQHVARQANPDNGITDQDGAAKLEAENSNVELKERGSWRKESSKEVMVTEGQQLQNQRMSKILEV